MGGFNFPPGMGTTLQATGTKRSAETMKDTTPLGTGGRSGTGLGVSYAAAQARSTRQPFGILDVSDEGNVKRVRR
ncbi:uncharacterized protein FOMMEDRAFT_23653 [Fomitiporia mediterranea MF3/22]|uniref:uncharacterized protein n=1 Tax=Fomitiporia mediterranea (strain MF3/22) TaxID=694068 RepID=UPI0004407DC8|nr:uncharacterized protein FOMMEDRAFT_23653 [Fomitiporia mediterranea MF3/22]EJC98403.1 hypothetical protein FOMMEDRAFT_23653 [Fomitiporia mediterranea MF3/22]